MAASDHINEHIKRFMPRAKEQGWDTCEGAFNSCTDAVSQVLSDTQGKHMQVAGAAFDTSKAHGDWQKIPDKYKSHHVPVIDGHVVDWTHRQFDPEAEFPLIEPVESYSNRWKKYYDI